MKIFRAVVIAVGISAIAILIWKLNVRVVLHTVARVRFGILLILALELVTLTLNAIAWRLSFAPKVAKSYPIFELMQFWLAMDGVNYFVPSGTIAGEVARASLLGGRQPIEVRTASVIISRIGQTIAQIAFVLAGFVFLVSRLGSLRSFGWITTAAAWLLGLIAVVVLTYLLLGGRWMASRAGASHGSRQWFRAMPGQMRAYFGEYPLRFAASVLVFGTAYVWPAVEAYWICHFIGAPVTPLIALTIEVLSVAIDGALFLIPAKIGTQELGKTAIFSLLGMPLSAGLAFGIIRHVREIVWALAGFGIYSTAHPRHSASVVR